MKSVSFIFLIIFLSVFYLTYSAEYETKIIDATGRVWTKTRYEISEALTGQICDLCENKVHFIYCDKGLIKKFCTVHKPKLKKIEQKKDESQ